MLYKLLLLLLLLLHSLFKFMCILHYHSASQHATDRMLNQSAALLILTDVLGEVIIIINCQNCAINNHNCWIITSFNIKAFLWVSIYHFVGARYTTFVLILCVSQHQWFCTFGGGAALGHGVKCFWNFALWSGGLVVGCKLKSTQTTCCFGVGK